MKKNEIAGQKYIVLGPLKIPYSTEREGTRCRMKLGPLTIPYRRSAADDRLCLPLCGREIPLARDRRSKHYALRRSLTDEKIETILTEELTPLLGYRPNLKQPRTFNEKINYYKLHDHDPLITRCCDKYAVKRYAAEKIGAQYALPVLGAWTRAHPASRHRQASSAARRRRERIVTPRNRSRRPWARARHTGATYPRNTGSAARRSRSRRL